MDVACIPAWIFACHRGGFASVIQLRRGFSPASCPHATLCQHSSVRPIKSYGAQLAPEELAVERRELFYLDSPLSE
jgi:hypothetical protein